MDGMNQINPGDGGYRKKTGNEGEADARMFLEQKGFRIVERNWRCGRGEIDLIAKDGDVLVFIEVKTKKHGSCGEPEDWISKRKQNQIGRLALGYLQKKNLADVECRFDVVTVDRTGSSPVINHIEDAFWVDSRASWRMF
jgi:putative endonuclease